MITTVCTGKQKQVEKHRKKERCVPGVQEEIKDEAQWKKRCSDARKRAGRTKQAEADQKLAACEKRDRMMQRRN